MARTGCSTVSKAPRVGSKISAGLDSTADGATVPIDPDFAAVADLSNYHVFLTEQGSHQHLVVTEHGPAGFAVEADKDLAALKKIPVDDLNGTFSGGSLPSAKISAPNGWPRS